MKLRSIATPVPNNVVSFMHVRSRRHGGIWCDHGGGVILGFVRDEHDECCVEFLSLRRRKPHDMRAHVLGRVRALHGARSERSSAPSVVAGQNAVSAQGYMQGKGAIRWLQ